MTSMNDRARGCSWMTLIICRTSRQVLAAGGYNYFPPTKWCIFHSNPALFVPPAILLITLRELMLRTTLWQRCLSCANPLSCLLLLHSDKGVLPYLALSGHAQLGAPLHLKFDCLVKKKKKQKPNKKPKTKENKKKRKTLLFCVPPKFLKCDGQILWPEVCLCGSRTATWIETAPFLWSFLLSVQLAHLFPSCKGSSLLPVQFMFLSSDQQFVRPQQFVRWPEKWSFFLFLPRVVPGPVLL